MLWELGREAYLRPVHVPVVLGCDNFLGVMNFRCLIFECVDALMPGIFLPQQSTCSHSSRPSFPNAQKKRKMKKPCSEFNMAKRNWKAVEASRIVRAPKTHISPNRAITPMMLIMSLKTVCRFALSLWLNCF